MRVFEEPVRVVIYLNDGIKNTAEKPFVVYVEDSSVEIVFRGGAREVFFNPIHVFVREEA